MAKNGVSYHLSRGNRVIITNIFKPFFFNFSCTISIEPNWNVEVSTTMIRWKTVILYFRSLYFEFEDQLCIGEVEKMVCWQPCHPFVGWSSSTDISMILLNYFDDSYSLWNTLNTSKIPKLQLAVKT